MNRTFLSLAAVFSTSSLLLVDSAVKGAAILMLATVVTMLLRRDSSATRHLVWLVAIVAILVVPVFSMLLPQWQILPAWAAIPFETPASDGQLDHAVTVDPVASPEPVRTAIAAAVSPHEIEQPLVPGSHIVAAAPVTEPGNTEQDAVLPEVMAANSEPSMSTWHWASALSVVWAIGCCILVLRLMAARLMLWSSERSGTVLGQSVSTDECLAADESVDDIVAEFENAARQLGVRQRVRLLIHSERTIPVVWGIFRFRLLLPAAARQWSLEQLRSVLLHELAHIKRRDTIAQLLAQLACAMHWFNPLVWFAAWRLHVERERACDDLVLGSGVRASAYAEHLLNVATRLSSSGWTQACGLAMAHSSSLEDRLAAVLSEQRNRRSVTGVIVGASLLLGTAIVIPVAMLHAAETVDQVEESDQPQEIDRSGDPTDQTSPEDDPAPADDDPAANTPASEKDVAPAAPAPASAPAAELKPQHKEGQELFAIWKSYARTDGKIPGAMIGRLGEWVKYFIELNDGIELAEKFELLLPRFKATVDWSQADAVALLDEATAIHTIPLNNMLVAATERIVMTGEPLPADLADAPWGQPAPNGLRAAWHLEPVAKEHRLGTSLKSRLLVHNSGKQTVFFIMPSWQQPGGHAARDAKDVAIKVSSTSWTTMSRMQTYRLAPGAYCETRAPGIGVGARTDAEDWANVRPGAWIEAKEGDELRLTPGAIEVRFSPSVAGTRHMNGLQKPKDAGDLWNKIVAERVARELPIPPAGSADREQLLRRVVRDLYGVDANQSEIDAFVRDRSPGGTHPLLAGQLVETRVKHNRTISPFTGVLPPGDITFRVLAADPDAATRPRVANGPGYYILGDKQRLHVEQSRNGDRHINKATIRFFSEPKPAPYTIMLPDGRLTFAIAWDRDAGVLWIAQSGLLRSYDFTNPAEVKEMRFAPGSIDTIPERFRDGLQSLLIVPVTSTKNRTTGKPSPGNRLNADTETRLQWGEPSNGLRAAIVRSPVFGKPEVTHTKDFELVVQNVSQASIRLTSNKSTSYRRRMTVRSKEHGWAMFRTVFDEPIPVDFSLQPGAVAVLALGPPERPKGTSISRNLDLVFFADMEITKAPAGAWTGKIASGEMFAALTGCGLLPIHKDARELFIDWNDGSRWNGTIPGGLIGQLATRVKHLTNFRPGHVTTPRLLKMLERLDASRDWSGREALLLLDELAAVEPRPIKSVLGSREQRIVRNGKPLPPELNEAPWGEAHSNGLRVAWLLDPQGREHRRGTALKSRVLFHNTGKNTVVFRTQSWRHGNHKARDAQGTNIPIAAAFLRPRIRPVSCRLKPGEFLEVLASGIGIGANRNPEDWRGKPVSQWLGVKDGDDVTFLPQQVVAEPFFGDSRWWFEFITERLALEKPLPMDGEVRRRMLYRVTHDLFGTSPTDDENVTFLSDRESSALESLAQKLAQRPDITIFAGGQLQSGPTKFRVLPAAPDSAEKPR